MRCFRFVLIFMFLALLGSMLHAKSPWGVLDSVPDTSFEIYAIDNLIDKRPIRYAVSEEITPEEEQIFKENMLKWPAETLRFIQASGRAQEFRDIIPILERELVLQRVALSAPPDIYLHFSNEMKFNVGGGFKEKQGNNPFSEIRINIDSRDRYAEFLLHEIGHYFGLADQYETARWKNSHPEYSSDVNRREKSVMDENPEITCDDADGFINLLDLRLAQRHDGQFSKRAQKGWKSLCRSSKNIYQNAKTINRQSVDSWVSADEITETVYQRKYKRGNLQQETKTITKITPIALFQLLDTDRVVREPKTNLVRAIYTNTKQQVTLSNGRISEKNVIYEKHFSYGKPTLRETKKVVPVSVREVIDGEEVNHFDFLIAEHGALLSLVPGLDEKSYFEIHMGYTILLESDSAGFHSYTVVDVGTKGKLEGKIGTDTATFSKDGQERTVSLPPDEDSDFYLHWALPEWHYACIRDFFKNFYAPLFGNKQEQVRKQVQDSLRMRR